MDNRPEFRLASSIKRTMAKVMLDGGARNGAKVRVKGNANDRAITSGKTEVEELLETNRS